MDQIKRPAWNRLGLAEVVLAEGALAVAFAVQHLHRQPAERSVPVDADHPAGGPDPFGHGAHGLARAAAGIQAACSSREADPVEQPPGRSFPHPGLRAQPVVFLRRVTQRVRVAPLLGLSSAHAPRCLPQVSRLLNLELLSRVIL